MTYTEILELIRAGYSKAEIDTMLSATPAPSGTTPAAQEPAPEPPAAGTTPTPAGTAPAQDHEPEQPAGAGTTPAPAQQTETEKLLAALGMKIDSMTAALHRANVNGVENPNNQLTPEQVIAQIINPHVNDNK